jgi:hypothetical protein
MRKRSRFSTQVQSHEFAALESRHPYGALPGGNRFLQHVVSDKSTKTIGPSDLLTDTCWDNVLGFCDGAELGKVVQTCRYLYVAGYQPELWRDLVLRKLGTNRLQEFRSSWRDTFVALYCPSAKDSSHVPMRMPGIYSDVFYRLHSCRAFALPLAWMDANYGTVPRISIEDMTSKVFTNNYEEPNQPVLITKAAKSWKAFDKWQDLGYLLNETKGSSFRATSGLAPLPVDFSLKAYLDYATLENLEEAPLYLFDRTALQPGSHLWNDYMADLRVTCPWWDPKSNENEHDLFKVLGEGQRPDHTWLIIGPRRSGSVFHIDPNGTHAWNAAIVGRKRWIFYPPGATPPGVYPSEDGDEVALPLSLGEWLFQFWDEHVERMQSAPPHERPLECTAMPGDVMFVPHGWWHAVINLDKINVAITHNYVSGSNLGNVLRFLSKKENQISGCRDRLESIKPDRLYHEFVTSLDKYRHDLLQRGLSQKDWTCQAWRNTSTNEIKRSGRKRRKAEISKSEQNITEKASLMARAKTKEPSFSFSFL